MEVTGNEPVTTYYYVLLRITTYYYVLLTVGNRSNLSVTIYYYLLLQITTFVTGSNWK